MNSVEEIVIGLKFAGRTDSRGARFLHGAPGARSSHSPSASAGLLLFALVAGVLLLLVAAFRFALGAPPTAGFWTTYLTPFFVVARFAGQAAPITALWLAIGVLLLGAIGCVLSVLTNCRLPDIVFNAVLGWQFFFLARVANSFLPPAGAPKWATLFIAQKMNLTLGVLLLLALWLAWAVRAKPPTPYGSSAPSRITKFLRKRRLPSRIVGAIVMAFAIIAILLVSRAAFWQPSTLVTPLRAIFGFLFCDAIYFAGKKLWLRLT